MVQVGRLRRPGQGARSAPEGRARRPEDVYQRGRNQGRQAHPRARRPVRHPRRGRQGGRQDQGAGFAGRHPHLVGGRPRMAALDWVFVAVLAASLLLGAWRGLVYEVLSVISWIAAFIVAQWLAPDAAALLPVERAPEAGRYAVGFVLVFIAVVFAGGAAGLADQEAGRGRGPAADRPHAGRGVRPGARRGAAAGGGRGDQHVAGTQRGSGGPNRRAPRSRSAALKGLKPVLPERFGQYLPGEQRVQASTRASTCVESSALSAAPQSTS